MLLSDAPVGFEFGIDCMIYELGPKFHGVAQIPKGIHFIYIGGAVENRQGFFVDVQASNDLVLAKWDTSKEELTIISDVSEATDRHVREEIRKGSLGLGLGSYPLQQHNTWLSLSQFITEDIIRKSNCGFGHSIVPGSDNDLIDSSYKNLSAMRIDAAEEFTDFNCSPSLPRQAQFTNIKSFELQLIERVMAQNSSGVEVTKVMLDKSALLLTILNHTHDNNWANLLGELQLSFLLFIMLFSHSGLHQWKLLLGTICESRTLLNENVSFTASFIRVLHSQLNFCPNDFFENELSQGNFMQSVIMMLFEAIDMEQHQNNGLYEYLNRLQSFVEKKFNLVVHFNSTVYSAAEDIDWTANDEDAPIVVSQDEIQQLENYRYHETTSNKNSNSNTQQTQLSSTNLSVSQQNELYSWRYPFLFEAMSSSKGTEDLVMTAMRIIDEFDMAAVSRSGSMSRDLHSTSAKERQRLKVAYEEATRFLSDEMQLHSKQSFV